MSRDSRSRSRSPLDDSDGENSPRSRRHDKKKYDRVRPTTGGGKRVPSECRIYVSNIPYEFKWQDLKDLFRSEVGNVAYVEMFNDDNGRPRGSAIVDFESSEMAQKAIEKMHRMEVKGRKLVVKERDEIVRSRDFMFLFNKEFDRDRGNRFGKDMDRNRGVTFNRGGNSFPEPPVNFGNTYGLSVAFLESLGITGPLVNKVFVANLDYKVTEEDLREVFKVAGKVTTAEVIKDQDGKSRGFGIVEYEHPLQAVQSISMLHNQMYYDRKLSIRLDRERWKSPKEEPAAKLPPGLKGLGMGLGANGEPIVDLSGLPSEIIGDPPQNVNSAGMPSLNSMTGGFNMSANAGMASNMRSPVNPSMPMMGMGTMDNLPMGGGNSMPSMGMGSPNVMNMGAGLTQNQVPSANSFGNPGMGMATGNGGAAGGAMFNAGNANFNNTSNSTEFNSNFSSSRNVVQITNLPMDYTWKNLKDLCRNYGDIRFAEIKSKGVGWVRFSSEAEARRTADMLDRQRFDGRVLDARII